MTSATETVDTTTGVINDDAIPRPRELPTPTTLDEANQQFEVLRVWLRDNSNQRTAKRRELRPVEEMYTAVYDSALLSSERTESRLREAEARQAVRDAASPDEAPVSLSERRSVLKLELKILEDLGHDVRAVMSTLQSVSKNLQADAFATGRQI